LGKSIDGLEIKNLTTPFKNNDESEILDTTPE
jgi:hypothetical protein